LKLEKQIQKEENKRWVNQNCLQQWNNTRR
jgi:hypothetical protein